MKRKHVFWPILLIFLIALSANASAAKVKISKKKATIEVGKTVQLKVSGTTQKVKWSSSNKKVATVTKKGKVTGKRAGSATIKAKVGSKTYKCKVTVKAVETAPPVPAAPAAPAVTPSTPATPAPEPSLSETSLSPTAGQQKQLILKNASGNVGWSSSNYRIADVASDGTVYAKFYGSCVIKATFGGKSYTCKVSVDLPTPKCYPQTGISLPGYGLEIQIDTFEAQFMSVQPDLIDTVSVVNNNAFNFYKPCLYRVYLKAHAQYNDGSNAADYYFDFTFTHKWEGYVNDVTEDLDYVRVKTDKNGDFEITKDLLLSSPADIIYLVTYL